MVKALYIDPLKHPPLKLLLIVAAPTPLLITLPAPTALLKLTEQMKWRPVRSKLQASAAIATEVKLA